MMQIIVNLIPTYKLLIVFVIHKIGAIFLD